MTSTKTESNFISYLPFLILISLISFVNILARVIYSPLTPLICKEMNLSHGETGNIFLVLSLGFSVTLFASQYISAKWSHKFTIILSVFTTGLALILTAYSVGFQQFRLAIFILGMSTGLFIPSAVALIRETIPSQHLGKALGVFGTAQSFAFILGPLYVDFFIRFLEWRQILSLFGFCPLIFGLFLLFLVSKEEKKSLPITFSFIKDVFRWPSFWILNLLLCVINGLNIGIYNMIPDYFENHRLLEMKNVNHIVIFARLISIVTAVIGGYLVDKLGLKKSLVAFLFLCGCVTIFMGIANPTLGLILFCVQSPVAACLLPIIHFGISTIVPTEKNAAIVSIMAPFGFAFGAGFIPQILGFLGDFRLYAEGFITFGLASLVCSLVFSMNIVYKHVHSSQLKSMK